MATASPPRPPAEAPAAAEVAAAVARARDGLLALQHPEGYWSFELEADCTIPAETILWMHFTDEVDAGLQARLAAYLRRHQEGDAWPLFFGGEPDLSCSVKAYYALKLAGDDPEAPHMRRARAAIRAAGGAERANVFTRIALAQFGQVPWRAVPFIPVEAVLLPRWFFFHLSRVSYWSRTVMVPLFILCSHKVAAVNPTGTGIRELFVTAPERARYFSPASGLGRLFLAVDRAGRLLEPAIPRRLRDRATRAAEAWFTARLGKGGLGAIFPAMVNAHEALVHLGYAPDHPLRQEARQALLDLVVERSPEEAYCQPCNSPIWDTGLACLALEEAAGGEATPEVRRALAWLAGEQLLEAPGDWRESHPDLPGGGWAFQFHNPHYPDLDDTAVVAWALHQAGGHEERVARAAAWIAGMQSRGGGFGAFDSDNTDAYLNEIPFADHGALLDPPTADVSARCLTLLSRLGDRHREARERCLAYLAREQEADGAWFGRWGTNYIYGTWSVLTALEAAGVGRDDPRVRRAVAWLVRRQNEDGGWGESNASYFPGREREPAPSTCFQTAWALLGLLAAGERESAAVARGVRFLLERQGEDGLWADPGFTAPGFPRVFYLKYHGYSRYFPLWALARYARGG
ncbi:MAG: squalene--hopene cyclase, partial [Nitrospirae bacterium]